MRKTIICLHSCLFIYFLHCYNESLKCQTLALTRMKSDDDASAEVSCNDGMV